MCVRVHPVRCLVFNKWAIFIQIQHGKSLHTHNISPKNLSQLCKNTCLSLHACMCANDSVWQYGDMSFQMHFVPKLSDGTKLIRHISIQNLLHTCRHIQGEKRLFTQLGQICWDILCVCVALTLLGSDNHAFQSNIESTETNKNHILKILYLLIVQISI